MQDKPKWLDVGGAIWVSAVVMQTVPVDVLVRSIRRHRDYDVCEKMAVSDEMHRCVFSVNKAAMDMVLDRKDVDAAGWRPRFSSLWTHPLGVTNDGAPQEVRYWILTDITQRLHQGSVPLGTVIITGRELRRHGFGIYSGCKPRDVSPALRALGCRDLLPSFSPQELDPGER